MLLKLMKAFYILTIALVVFLGSLMISQGMQEEKVQTGTAVVRQIIDSQEGSVL